MGFLKNIEEIRARACQQITDGLVTKGYKLNPMQAVGVLNEALATELVLCTALQVSLVDMLREDLVAERMAIETYREIARYFGDKDPTSRVLMETILAKEEEHADELSDLLFVVDPASGHKI